MNADFRAWLTVLISHVHKVERVLLGLIGDGEPGPIGLIERNSVNCVSIACPLRPPRPHLKIVICKCTLVETVFTGFLSRRPCRFAPRPWTATGRNQVKKQALFKGGCYVRLNEIGDR